jgi:hypothetical protein
VLANLQIEKSANLRNSLTSLILACVLVLLSCDNIVGSTTNSTKLENNLPDSSTTDCRKIYIDRDLKIDVGFRFTVFSIDTARDYKVELSTSPPTMASNLQLPDEFIQRSTVNWFNQNRPLNNIREFSDDIVVQVHAQPIVIDALRVLPIVIAIEQSGKKLEFCSNCAGRQQIDVILFCNGENSGNCLSDFKYWNASSRVRSMNSISEISRTREAERENYVLSYLGNVPPAFDGVYSNEMRMSLAINSIHAPKNEWIYSQFRSSSALNEGTNADNFMGEYSARYRTDGEVATGLCVANTALSVNVSAAAAASCLMRLIYPEIPISLNSGVLPPVESYVNHRINQDKMPNMDRIKMAIDCLRE